MTEGVIKTKGTRLFFVSSESDVLKVACATGITGLGGAADQIDQTCLESEESEYVAGMNKPGVITVPINFIPRSAAHQALLDLDDNKEVVSWLIALSDSAADPTIANSDERLESSDPTTVEFLSYVSDFNVDIVTNEIVRATLTLQRSGAKVWNLPTADLA
jgi:hypothetical protein